MSETRLFFNLYFLLLSVTVAVFYDVVGHEPVKASVGEDVVLPCHLEPPFDVNRLTVEWTWNGHIVHLYRNGGDNYDDQDEQFRDRTSMFHSEMSRGNISLKLTDVTEKDAGVYLCYVPRLENQIKRGNVNLTVNPRNEAGGREETGGNDETEDDQKETDKDQTGAIVGGVVGAVLLVVIPVPAVIALYYYKRWRTEKKNLENHHQGEEAAVLDPLNSKPVQNPQGAAAE